MCPELLLKVLLDHRVLKLKVARRLRSIRPYLLKMERKRKRTGSGNSILTAATVTENLHRYGEILQHCDVHITRNIRECGNSLVLKYVCALLNSGGGILHMRNLDNRLDITMSKHLDTWWSGIECKLVDIISRDDICNYFDLIGNFDDPDLYLFVKTAEHLTTLDYHARLPTDTATHDVTYQSVIKLLTCNGEPGCLYDLPMIPSSFVFNQSAEELKKETKQIQFKLLTSPQCRDSKPLAERIKTTMLRYVSAFANHEGGHIFFGIDDERAAVIGENISVADQKRTERLVHSQIQRMIWKDETVHAQRGTHWNIRFFPVQNSPRRQRRVVIVISVCRYPGGVFIVCPESYYSNTEGKVLQFFYSQWKEAILNPFRDVPELHNRFVKIPTHVPLSPLIFTLPHTIRTIREKILMGKTDVSIQPRHFLDKFVASQYKEHVQLILECLTKGDNSFCLGAECWGLKIPYLRPIEVLCDVLLVSEAEGLHFVTFARQTVPQALHHSQMVAAMLKNKLIQNGGCAEKFGLVCHCVDLSAPMSDLPLSLPGSDIYPSHFSITKKKFEKIFDSIIITMAAYSQHAPVLRHGTFNFLLTRDQFELLWTQQFTKELWVHGPPGAGKTVAAVQMIEELHRRGCKEDEILYLAENDKLCDFVRHHRMCCVATRRGLLEDVKDPEVFELKYGNICNVIVDEAQNFKDRDGDWYSLAEKLANRKAPEHLHLCSNYFWVFMDYSQKVHKFRAGLPAVIGKNNFMLSEISRNTKEIFDFTTRFMSASEDVDPYIHGGSLQRVHSVPKLGHQYSSGKGVDILSCKEAEIKSLLEKVMAGLLQNGIRESDIAILVGKRSQLDKLQAAVNDLKVTDEQMTSCVDKGNCQAQPSGSELPPLSASCKSTTDETEGVFERGTEYPVSYHMELTSEYGSQEDSENLSQSDDTHDSEVDESDIFENFNDSFINMDSSVSNRSIDCAGVYKGIDVPPGGSAENEADSVFDTNPGGVAVDTVRRFSGMDKAAIIGVNPEVNEEHADFNRFIVSLATRARDNLVIITTSECVRDKLEKLAYPMADQN